MLFTGQDINTLDKVTSRPDLNQNKYVHLKNCFSNSFKPSHPPTKSPINDILYPVNIIKLRIIDKYLALLLTCRHPSNLCLVHENLHGIINLKQIFLNYIENITHTCTSKNCLISSLPLLPGTFRTMACSCPLGETQLNCLLKQKENKQKEILVLKEAIQS